MKFDEQKKHLLIGAIVLLSVIAVLLPALLKKPADGMSETMYLSLKLPPKPSEPQVIVPDKKELFQTVKVAHVDLSEDSPSPDLARKPIKAQSISASRQEKAEKSILVKNHKTSQSDNTSKTAHKEHYAVQLASFTVEKNAELLVGQLKNKGYKAFYNKIKSKKGHFYQVIVGQVKERKIAQHLQKQLADVMHLNGFVIKQG